MPCTGAPSAGNIKRGRLARAHHHRVPCHSANSKVTSLFKTASTACRPEISPMTISRPTIGVRSAPGPTTALKAMLRLSRPPPENLVRCLGSLRSMSWELEKTLQSPMRPDRCEAPRVHSSAVGDNLTVHASAQLTCKLLGMPMRYNTLLPTFRSGISTCPTAGRSVGCTHLRENPFILL